MEQPVAGPALLGQLAHPRPHGRQVLVRLRAAEVGKVAPLPAWRLEGVVDLCKVAAQHRLAPEAVHEPQVLERGDVAEVPDEGTHQLGVDPLEVLRAHRLDEGERALACGIQAVEERLRVGCRGSGCGGGRHLVASSPVAGCCYASAGVPEPKTLGEIYAPSSVQARSISAGAGSAGPSTTPGP